VATIGGKRPRKLPSACGIARMIAVVRDIASKTVTTVRKMAGGGAAEIKCERGMRPAPAWAAVEPRAVPARLV
jgi:hypothetical protein